jgi:uncharacterized membrane protein
VKLHPLHPVSVHAPLACIVFAPLADLGAVLSHRSEFWFVSALMCAGAGALGLIAATFGALDFERAFAKAPKTVSWHATLMAAAVLLDVASAIGRFGPAFTALAPPPAWAIGASAVALVSVAIGGGLGGELVYRHGINVERSGLD